ncbi:MAG: CRISPR-associated endonuclease Cas1 [Alphaproteobacteria bacterium]|nr:CRISPR-associated endonuclease Cas1 [Alphaproteobacteria bacterium]
MSLPFEAPRRPAGMPPLPVRMLNEFVYCPRLAYLEWVQREWADSADTVEGRTVHRAVDAGQGALPSPDAVERAAEEGERLHTRSIRLSSETLGLVAVIDVVEARDGCLTPVDYKRGARPHVEGGAWLPERVQSCAQGLLLREAGHRSDEGALYFAGSRERVRVPFDEALLAATRAAIEGLTGAAGADQPPPPLEDSPKCPRCSLVGICLPDEVNFLARQAAPPRPLAVARDEAMPLWVQSPDARIAKRGARIEVKTDEGATSVALGDVSQVIVQGPATLTTPCLHELMRREVPVTWLSLGGWFLGHTVGTGHGNVEWRTAQYRTSFDPAACLRLARGLVRAKIRNCRTLLRRNAPSEAPADRALAALARLADDAERADGLDGLLGIEGAAAALWFRSFATLLRPPDGLDGFEFERRNRRPPRDPVNALLSYGYALLTRQVTVSLSAVGLDPYRGFFHQPRWGRPALALDMMEPLRPLLCDSVVLGAVNGGEVKAGHFVRSGDGTALTAHGRKAFIGAFERRLGQEITHPVFGYKVSWRRVLELQARLLGRHLAGEIPEWPHVMPR